MEVFGLMFVVSFVALLTTLVVLHIRKSMNKGKGDFVKETETLVEKSYFETTSDVTTKWRLTVPKHKTRIKARNKRKQRNKR